uniref:Uncharacterized protein n=1 Tax=viral metagenome TaxID=1070528 RepID=A0A6M3LQU1_9ZZZZ
MKSKLLDRIHEVALKVAHDYPNIQKCDVLEQISAIESSYEGTNQANKDLHKLIKILREKLGMSVVDMIKLWEEHKDESILHSKI